MSNKQIKGKLHAISNANCNEKLNQVLVVFFFVWLGFSLSSFSLGVKGCWKIYREQMTLKFKLRISMQNSEKSPERQGQKEIGM